MARHDEDVFDPRDYEGKLPRTGIPAHFIETDEGKEAFVRGIALADRSRDANEVRAVYTLKPLEPEALQAWLD
jgi:hypothetical protein